MLRVACCRRVMLPATLQGEIVKTNDMSDETFLKKAIRIKKRQLQYLAVLYDVLALAIQFVWIGCLIWITPYISGIYRSLFVC